MASVVEQQVSSRNSQIPGSFIPGQQPCATEEIVALFMLERAAEHGNQLLTPLEINKLVYIAHGWILGALGRPLIDNKIDQIQAWMRGPVVVQLHYLLAPFRNSPLHLYDFYSSIVRQQNSNNEGLLPNPGQVKPSGLTDFEAQNAEVIKGLDWVYETYTQYSGGQLITLTTQENSPWALNFRPGLLQRWGLINFERHIPDHVIWDHYRRRIGR